MQSTRNFANNSSEVQQQWEHVDRTSITFACEDKPGILSEALLLFTANQVNMTSITSKPPKVVDDVKIIEFHVDCEGAIEDPKIKNTLSALKEITTRIDLLNSTEAPWFPTKLSDFEFIGKQTLGAGEGIDDVDHPGFHDENYRQRREIIA